MSDQADQPSDARVKPWTIKGVIPEVRNGAIAAAERARQPIGEWVSRAIRGQVQADRQENRAPVPVGPGSAPTADLVELEPLVALTASLSSAGAPPPKAVSRSAYGLIHQRLAGMKGPTEPRSGPTKKAVSQTGGRSHSPSVWRSFAVAGLCCLVPASAMDRGGQEHARGSGR